MNPRSSPRTVSGIVMAMVSLFSVVARSTQDLGASPLVLALDIAAVVCLVLAIGFLSGFARRRTLKRRVIRGAARPGAVYCKLCGQEVRAESDEAADSPRCLECGQAMPGR